MPGLAESAVDGAQTDGDQPNKFAAVSTIPTNNAPTQESKTTSFTIDFIVAPSSETPQKMKEPRLLLVATGGSVRTTPASDVAVAMVKKRLTMTCELVASFNQFERIL
jgi:hypothetical protein